MENRSLNTLIGVAVAVLVAVIFFRHERVTIKPIVPAHPDETPKEAKEPDACEINFDGLALFANIPFNFPRNPTPLQRVAGRARVL